MVIISPTQSLIAATAVDGLDERLRRMVTACIMKALKRLSKVLDLGTIWKGCAFKVISRSRNCHFIYIVFKKIFI